MLRELRIRNFAVIESVAVEFRPGLNVLTGETVAGKSIGKTEQQRLLEPARQLELLDRFADTEELRERVAGLVATFRAARAETERMRAAERDRAQREDLLRFQLSELDGARLRPGEEEELRQERRRRQHADKLTAGLADVAALRTTIATPRRHGSTAQRRSSATWRVSTPRSPRPSRLSTRPRRSSRTCR